MACMPRKTLVHEGGNWKKTRSGASGHAFPSGSFNAIKLRIRLLFSTRYFVVTQLAHNNVGLRFFAARKSSCVNFSPSWMEIKKDLLKQLPKWCDDTPFQIKAIAVKEAHQAYWKAKGLCFYLNNCLMRLDVSGFERYLPFGAC